MATMGEIMRNPEVATEEDKEALKKMAEAMNKIAGRASAYPVEEDMGRTQDQMSESLYRENIILSTVLESFVHAEHQTFKEMNEYVFKLMDKKFVWEVSIPFYELCVGKLLRLGLIAITDKTDEFNPSLSITEDGIRSLQQQTFASLAQTALYNEQSKQLNTKILVVAVCSMIVAIASIFISLIGLIAR